VKPIILGVLALSGLAPQGSPPAPARSDWPQWRGPNRDGVSTETGLLKEWPAGGPPLLWTGKGLGEGYSGVAVVGDRVYTAGQRADGQYLICLNAASGKEHWATRFAPSYRNSYGSGPRCTPTVDGDRVYALGADGTLICAEAATGKARWNKDLVKDLGGKTGSRWGYSESPLVDGDKVVCVPGGEQATLAGFDKMTGAVVWKGVVPSGEGAEYSSIVISQGAGVRQYVVLVDGGTIGVATADGRFLWRYDKLGNNTANCPTPIVFDDYVFTAAGYGKGGALLKLVKDGDGVRAEEVYLNRELTNRHGGVVKLGDHIYGDRDQSGQPWCAEVKTGTILWQRQARAGGKGGRGGRNSAAVTYADGRLYIRYENGTLTLVEATPKAFREISSFEIPGKSGQPSWPHPVVAGGRLYIRDQDSLLCFDIKGE
jgi:outer membrane protein assembly factor BamB